MITKPSAPATDRNRDAILAVLETELLHVSSVLEIGSGTGQHGIFFAENLPHLSWQTSDRLTNHEGINAWIEDAKISNVRKPIALDVLDENTLTEKYDCVFSANTAHIMSMDAVVSMFKLVGNSLTTAGMFCLYGPFNLDGNFTSESNRRFDASLKSQDPLQGIRDLEALQDLGLENGLQPKSQYAMPANNMLIVWQLK